jgi:hypothetical protein
MSYVTYPVRERVNGAKPVLSPCKQLSYQSPAPDCVLTRAISRLIVYSISHLQNDGVLNQSHPQTTGV